MSLAEKLFADAEAEQNARGDESQLHIIILDDSSSALDFATDARLRKSIRNNLSESTAFIVTQRTNSIRDANKIIVINNISY